jgi:hypothetical protein
MSSHEEIKAGNRAADPDWAGDSVLEQALGNFRQSVHAWSDAAYSRPRTAMQIVTGRSWRFAVGWALGCVLISGSLAGGLFERHHLRVLAQLKAEQEAKQRQLATQPRTGSGDEDLLAAVDTDISRTVPAAMEPLAQLMESSEDQ